MHTHDLDANCYNWNLIKQKCGVKKVPEFAIMIFGESSPMM